VIFPATLPATISDRLIVSITDPLGNTTSFERSKFVNPATGETAIGPGGGTVEGVGGVEMRIPEGALDKGVTLKIESVSAAQLAADLPGQRPDLEGAHTGSALKITSEDKPTFKKAVDLAFPLPDFASVPESERPPKPEDAFFYVYRRLELPPAPDGTPRAAFETIDHAFIEGEGANRKVVTASYPFPVYQTNFGSVDGSGHLTSMAGVYCFLLWSYLPLLLAQPLPGAITGKVLRVKFKPNEPNNPGAAVEYEPIAGALVSGVDAAGNPMFNRPNGGAAVTQADGTYTMFDPRYVGGPITMSAFVDGEMRTATGFEANPANWATTSLHLYRNIATANITFPAVTPPPPPPAVQIKVMRLENGVRKDTGGIVVANTPIVIGMSADNAEVRGAALQGPGVSGEYGVRIDPLRGEPTGMQFLLDPDLLAANPGSYTVTASALSPPSEAW
jgi:hypothetical protein